MAISIVDIEKELCVGKLSGNIVYLKKGKIQHVAYRLDRITSKGIVVVPMRVLLPSESMKVNAIPSVWLYCEGARFISIKQLKKYSITKIDSDNVLENLVNVSK